MTLGRTAPPEVEVTAPEPTWRRRLERLRHGRLERFVRFCLSSLLATAVSAGVFALAYHLNAGPRGASVAGFFSGFTVNFTAGRFFAWRHRTRERLGRQMVGYAVVAVATLLLATWATTTAQQYAQRVDNEHVALVVEAAYLGTYGIMFLLKFALLDRLVFASRAR